MTASSRRASTARARDPLRLCDPRRDHRARSRDSRGVHTGECDLVDGKLAGLAVNIGARVAAQAEEGDVLVSGTVKDLVARSGLEFEPRGTRELKGLGKWPLYAVVR